MNKERLAEIMHADKLTLQDLEEINNMIAAYPGFPLPRFLRLKAMYQLGMEVDTEEARRTAVYSPDRKHLYHWMRGETTGAAGFSLLQGRELEFLDEGEDGIESSRDEGDDPAGLLVIDNEGDADERGIPDKDEADMEEPEAEEPESTPIIDPIDDEEPEDVAETPAGEPEAAVNEMPRGDEMPSAREQVNESNRSAVLIEKFLNSEPGVIRADKETRLEGDVSAESVKEDDSFITDTLAKIYVRQGLHAKAIYAYERLSLKYPEKSAYFAAQIEKIKQNTNS